MKHVETYIAYLHGRFEKEIELHAKAIGCPEIELAKRVGNLLAGHTQEQQLMLEGVSNLPAEATKPHKRLRKVEVPDSTRSNSAQKSYWQRMTPEQRKAEMRRRQRKWTPEAKAKWKHSKSQSLK